MPLLHRLGYGFARPFPEPPLEDLPQVGEQEKRPRDLRSLPRRPEGRLA
jgi:hypothetical protein